jgi:WD40 repeat protein
VAGGSLAWSPDGSLLAVGSRDTNIYVCTFPGGKIQAGKIQAVLRGHEHFVTGVEFHPSRRLLASTSPDGTTRLWCFSPGGELMLPGEQLLGFCRDGRRLVTKSFEEITEWELADPGSCLQFLPHGQGPSRGPWGIAFAPDGRLLASASQDGVLLWDADAARLIGPVPSGDGYALAFSPNGRQLFTSGPGGWMRWPIVPERGGQVLRVGPGMVVRATTAESRSLRIDVAGTGDSVLLGAGDGGVDFVPLAEPGRARRLGTHDGLGGVALSPDGRWAASVGGGDTVCVWDVSRGILTRRLPHGGDHRARGYGGAAFSPDGRWLVTGFRSDFCFWEIGSWEL